MKQVPKEDKTPLRGPLILEHQALNATGAHLLTCGWVYMTNKEKAPNHNSAVDGLPWHHYPKFKQADLDALTLPEEAKQLEGKRYAVITTGVTTPSRNIKPEYYNMIIDHVIAKGLTPVFLGKRVTGTGNQRNIHTVYSDQVNYKLGVDLLDKTSLMQAASIMSRAAFVVGHDNGLLHLAGCTEVPIVFGYNLASPEHREPVRQIGKVYNVHLEHKDLACTFCQSNTNFVIGYNFRQCFYADLKCMDLLFENNAERWRVKMDEALS
jgi:ADP-heptose:LPS heptosyltransferase